MFIEMVFTSKAPEPNNVSSSL